MNERWSKTNVALHWFSAVAIVALAVMGFVMSDLPAAASARLWLSRLHGLFGFTLMAVTVWRLLLRWRGKSPAPLALPPLHRLGVNMVHGLIYVSLFALGASGLVTAVVSEFSGYLRGAVASAPELRQMLSREVHEVLVLMLLGAIALHVGGALVQQVRRGGVLRRMVLFVR